MCSKNSGGLIGNTITYAGSKGLDPILPAMAVVLTLALTIFNRPPLEAFQNHLYLAIFSEIGNREQTSRFEQIAGSANLSDRENR